MPRMDSCGTMSPLELLRQFFDTAGWYDRKDRHHPFRRVVDVRFAACMGAPGGGRAALPPRFRRHFHVIGIPPVETSHAARIFQTILDSEWSGFPPDITNLSAKFVKSTLSVYTAACMHLRPTPSRAHYAYTLRDVAKVVFGMVLLKKEKATRSDKVQRLWVHEVLRVFSDIMFFAMTVPLSYVQKYKKLHTQE